MKRTLLSIFFVIAAPIAAQTVNASGTWLNIDGPYAPWTVQLKQDRDKLTGTMEQNGGLRGSVDIYEGTVNGNAVSFKARSPDGAREITFTGTITGDEITLNRSTLDMTGGSQGGRGLFGTEAAPRFTIRRGPAASGRPAAISGATGAANVRLAGAQRWVVTEGVAFVPWTLDLTVEDKTVTGAVGQARSDPHSGYTTTVIGPFPVYDGRASGSTIDFKVKTGDGGRIITFHGTSLLHLKLVD